MTDFWVIKTNDNYYLVKGMLGTFSKDIRQAKQFKDEKSAGIDIRIKELKRCRPVRIYKEEGKNEGINV